MSIITIVTIVTIISLVCQVLLLVLGPKARDKQIEEQEKRLRFAVNDEWKKCMTGGKKK